MCGCLSHAPSWRPGPQPRHVPWLRIKPATFWFAVKHSIHWATRARACTGILIWIFVSWHFWIVMFGILFVLLWRGHAFEWILQVNFQIFSQFPIPTPVILISIFMYLLMLKFLYSLVNTCKALHTQDIVSAQCYYYDWCCFDLQLVHFPSFLYHSRALQSSLSLLFFLLQSHSSLALPKFLLFAPHHIVHMNQSKLFPFFWADESSTYRES